MLKPQLISIQYIPQNEQFDADWCDETQDFHSNQNRFPTYFHVQQLRSEILRHIYDSNPLVCMDFRMLALYYWQ